MKTLKEAVVAVDLDTTPGCWECFLPNKSPVDCLYLWGVRLSRRLMLFGSHSHTPINSRAQVNCYKSSWVAILMGCFRLIHIYIHIYWNIWVCTCESFMWPSGTIAIECWIQVFCSCYSNFQLVIPYHILTNLLWMHYSLWMVLWLCTHLSNKVLPIQWLEQYFLHKLCLYCFYKGTCVTPAITWGEPRSGSFLIQMSLRFCFITSLCCDLESFAKWHFLF